MRRNRTLRSLRLAAAAAGLAVAVSACGVTSSGSDTADAGKPMSDLRVMVPNTPGGGYDITARTAAKVMEDNDITSGTEVFNLDGAGGTVGLARTVNEKGNGNLAMMMGLGVVGASYTNNSKSTLSQTTPIVRLIEEYGAVMVPKDSPFKTVDDLVKAWKANPKGISVGGGSSPGGPDHLLPMQLAQAVGVNPKDVNFVQYDGGGDLLPAILGDKVDVATSGLGEFKDQIAKGDIRVLAISGDKRVDGVDAPTFKEAGIDLVFTNWRGIVAPPGISSADKTKLVDAFTKMHATSEWKDALEANSWTDAFQTSDEFASFLTAQDKRVRDTLSELGLA